jgi:hypothetical protein
MVEETQKEWECRRLLFLHQMAEIQLFHLEHLPQAYLQLIKLYLLVPTSISQGKIHGNVYKLYRTLCDDPYCKK